MVSSSTRREYARELLGKRSRTFAAAATYAAWPCIIDGLDPPSEPSLEDIFLPLGFWEL